MGDEPSSSSAVELVEKAGDSGRSTRVGSAGWCSGPSSATAAGGGDDRNEEIVWVSAGKRGQSCSRRVCCFGSALGREAASSPPTQHCSSDHAAVFWEPKRVCDQCLPLLSRGPPRLHQTPIQQYPTPAAEDLNHVPSSSQQESQARIHSYTPSALSKTTEHHISSNPGTRSTHHTETSADEAQPSTTVLYSFLSFPLLHQVTLFFSKMRNASESKEVCIKNKYV